MDSTIFRYSPRQLFGTLTDSTIFLYSQRFYLFRYSPGQFFDTVTVSTYSRYPHEFYNFSLLTRSVFWYFDGFYLFPALARSLQFSGPHKDSTFSATRPDSFSVLSQILPILGTRNDLTIFRYSPSKFLGTLTDSTYSRHSHPFYRISVLTKILPFPLLA